VIRNSSTPSPQQYRHCVTVHSVANANFETSRSCNKNYTWDSSEIHCAKHLFVWSTIGNAEYTSRCRAHAGAGRESLTLSPNFNLSENVLVKQFSSQNTAYRTAGNRRFWEQNSNFETIISSVGNLPPCVDKLVNNTFLPLKLF